LINLVFPLGNQHGWGVCGWHLSQELARLGPITLISDPFALSELGDELEGMGLKGMWRDKKDFPAAACLGRPMLQPVNNLSFLPWEPALRGAFNAGYIFFEEEYISPQNRENARRGFDLIVAGSSWCEKVLRQNGLTHTCAIAQGVNRRFFNPCQAQKTALCDRFVVFSGGKFELRKGQDLVIRAFKVLQDRHADVLLVNAWANRWLDSLKSMAHSPHIELRLGPDFISTINQTLAGCGIDLNRVVTLAPKPHPLMANIYKNTDVGVFPNRCEGGTNLVLMEYMACGKPAIASDSSGHKDVAKAHNAILLTKLGKLKINRDGRQVAAWDEPDLEELVEKLEWAYQHAGAIGEIGQRAGESLKSFTWEAAAQKFYHLLSDGAGQGQAAAV